MFTNPWVVGIVGGIISGIAVFFFTNIVFSKVSKKDYYKKINKANEEIVVLLIMSVSEGKIPTLTTIKSILSSLSRKYGIKSKDMNNSKETIEDIIKEIFSANFISIDKKIELSNELASMIAIEEELKESEDRSEESVNISNFRIIMSVFLAMVSTLLAAVTLSMSVIDGLLYSKDDAFMILIISIVTLTLVILLMTLYYYKRNEKNRENETSLIRITNKNKQEE